MKKNLLYCLLALVLPVFLYLGAAAQEDASGSGNEPLIEKSEGEQIDAPVRRDVKPAGSEDASGLDSAAKQSETGAAATESARRAERKKREIRKQPERKAEEIKEEAGREEGAANIDRAGGDGLLMIDHERIRYNRIPGITVKKEEPGEDLVKVPDDIISDELKEEKKSGGIFGKNTKTIAGWGIVIFIFILFAIYSRTRSKKSRRGTVRTITKR